MTVDARQNVTLVIQGCLTEETLAFHLEHYKNYKIIYSLWDCDSIEVPYRPNITTIRSSQTSTPGSHNFALQVKSTAVGLDAVNTDYAIKLRADEYYSNIDYIADTVVQDPSRLHVLPIFFRPYNLFPFHISDHLVAGTRENLKAMFDTCYQRILNSADDWWNFVTPEIILTETYLKQRTGQSIEGRRELVPQYFNILDLNCVKPYLVSVNFMELKFYSNFEPNPQDSITSLDNY